MIKQEEDVSAPLEAEAHLILALLRSDHCHQLHRQALHPDQRRRPTAGLCRVTPKLDSLMQTVAVHHARALKASGLSADIYKTLMKRFEKAAAHYDIRVDDRLRPVIYDILLREHLRNHKHFKPQGKTEEFALPSATVLHGDLTGLADRHIGNDPREKTYAQYFEAISRARPKQHRDFRYIFKYAVTRYTTDPQGFLNTVIADVERLPQQHIAPKHTGNVASAPTFGEFFSGYPAIFLRAATQYTGAGKAEDFLNDVVEQVMQLEGQFGTLTRNHIVDAILAREDPAGRLEKLASRRAHSAAQRETQRRSADAIPALK